jgi:hypothetical protein
MAAMTLIPSDFAYDHFLHAASLALCGHLHYAAEHCDEILCPNDIATCPRHWLGEP